MSVPILAYPNPNREYLLETNASKLGLGAMLSQKQSDRKYHPVAFGSRALHGAEVNYHSTKLEFLAMKWSIKHFQTCLLGHGFKVHTDNNPLMYFFTLPNMDAMKQRWINELAKYDFALEYQKGKNNTVANALSRIKEEWLTDEEADKFLEFFPVIPGDKMVIKIFKEEGCGWKPESPPPYTMSSATMKAIFNNLTLGAGRRAELECNVDSTIHDEADSIEVSVKSARLNSQMHVTNWAEAQWDDPEIRAAMDLCQLDRKKSKPWAQQLLKFKSHLGPNKNTLAGKSLLRNADQLTLCGGLLYHRYTPKYQVDKVKHFVVPRAHRRTAIDGCHHDVGHQGKKRMESLVSDQFWWLGVYKAVDWAVKNCGQCQLYGGREGGGPGDGYHALTVGTS